MTTMACCSGDALHQIERQRFVGNWELVAASRDGEVLHDSDLAPFSAELGTSIRFKDGAYQVLDDQWRLGLLKELNWEIVRWEPGSIWVFWFQGIYEFKGNDDLWICVKYHGQGVEGEEARRWRPPADFAVHKGADHVLFVLKRR